jgi:hypothetical protein
MSEAHIELQPASLTFAKTKTAKSTSEVQIEVDPANVMFAKTMRIATLVALAIMIGAGIAYLTGTHDMVGVDAAVQHWDQSATDFWQSTAGSSVGGYSWFDTHLTTADGVSVLGVALLALVPLVSILAWLPKAGRTYKVITGVLAVEFLVAILRPFF